MGKKENHIRWTYLFLVLVLLAFSSNRLSAQWSFTATLTYSGKCYGAGSLPSVSVPINGIPTKAECESLRGMLLSIQVGGECRVSYRCTSCTGSDMVNSQQMMPGSISFGGTETGKAFFSPSPGQSTQDWINSVQEKAQSLGFNHTNSSNNGFTLPRTGDDSFDKTYQDGVVAYIGKSRVPIDKDPSQLIVNTQQEAPSLPSLKEIKERESTSEDFRMRSTLIGHIGEDMGPDIEKKNAHIMDKYPKMFNPSIEEVRETPPTFSEDFFEVMDRGIVGAGAFATVAVSGYIKTGNVDLKEALGKTADGSRTLTKVLAIERENLADSDAPSKVADEVVDYVIPDGKFKAQTGLVKNITDAFESALNAVNEVVLDDGKNVSEKIAPVLEEVMKIPIHALEDYSGVPLLSIIEKGKDIREANNYAHDAFDRAASNYRDIYSNYQEIRKTPNN
jgi:hypothetical protein